VQSLRPVPFRNATIFLADIDGAPYTPMKPIVEGMGLAWQPQHGKLKTNKRLSSSITEIVIEGSHGKQRRMTCLPLRKLPGWLTSIQAGKVRPEIRATVEAYQAECDDALWDYWSTGHAVRPSPASYAESLRMRADEVERRALRRVALPSREYS